MDEFLCDLVLMSQATIGLNGLDAEPVVSILRASELTVGRT
jgi:hypothetical protein